MQSFKHELVLVEFTSEITSCFLVFCRTVVKSNTVFLQLAPPALI